MKQFKVNDRIEFKCTSGKTRNGFKHTAKIFIDGVCKDETSVGYLNRTWEAYEFESVMVRLVEKTKALKPEEKPAVMEFLKNYKETNSFGIVAMAAKMGEFFAEKKEDQNKWKKRMIEAGLGAGVSFPDDWDSLSEDEKERRLNGVIKEMEK